MIIVMNQINLRCLLAKIKSLNCEIKLSIRNIKNKIAVSPSSFLNVLTCKVKKIAIIKSNDLEIFRRRLK